MLEYAVDFFHIKNRHREGKFLVFRSLPIFRRPAKWGWALNQESPHLIHPWKIGGWAFARTWAYTPESTVITSEEASTAHIPLRPA